MKSVLKNSANPLTMLLMAFAMAFIFSCSSDGEGIGDGSFSKESFGSGNGDGVCDASETEKCCGASAYNPDYEFCYENSKVGAKCGERKETYDPDAYQCKPRINPNGIYLKTPVAYGGESYEAVLIGEQTWMARNLNYETENGSECYGYLTKGAFYCNQYGRLYNWSTAMGACPDGWHLPSQAEWAELVDYLGGRTKAGMYLKAANSGWSTGNDAYGFAALAGGMCVPFDQCSAVMASRGEVCGSFNVCGWLWAEGYWWTATEQENDSNRSLYMRLEMSDLSKDHASFGFSTNRDYDTTMMHSVRCILNNKEVSQ